MADDVLSQASRILSDAYLDEVLGHTDYWGRPRYYGMNGQPIKPSEWNRLMESGERHVANTFIHLGQDRVIQVSTVLLGLDHSFHPNSRPIIFETMVFVSRALDGHPLDLYQMRYSTYAQAKKGHKRILRVVQRYHRHKQLIHKGRKP